MAYEGKQWQCGDVINADDLNRIERGIEAVGIETNIQNPTDGQTLKYDAESGKWVNGESGGSSTLVVTATEDNGVFTLDHTWQEIADAYPNVILNEQFGGTGFQYTPVASLSSMGSEYYVVFGTHEYKSNSSNGYPEESFT